MTEIEEQKEDESQKPVKRTTRRVINFRISPEEEEMLNESCKVLGVNRSVFFRNSIKEKYKNIEFQNITLVADDLSKAITPRNTGIVNHRFAKLVMKKGITVNLDDGSEMKISNLSKLFDFIEKYVFTKS